MNAFPDPERFPALAPLAEAAPALRREVVALDEHVFRPAPDSLSLPGDGYDERGWSWFPIWGEGARAGHRARCPVTARVTAGVRGLVNAGLSRFRPGTVLSPHRGELEGVLRAHLPLVVPNGDLGLRVGSEVRVWREGRLLVFDDSREHAAWNRGDGDRIVLLVTFRPREGELEDTDLGREGRTARARGEPPRLSRRD